MIAGACRGHVKSTRLAAKTSTLVGQERYGGLSRRYSKATLVDILNRLGTMQNKRHVVCKPTSRSHSQQRRIMKI